MTGLAVCFSFFLTPTLYKGASGVVVSHHGCSALIPSRLHRRGERSAAPGSAGSQTIREMAEGVSGVSNPAALFINEGIVSISELMGVTSEAPVRSRKQDRTHFSGKLEGLLSLA